MVPLLVVVVASACCLTSLATPAAEGAQPRCRNALIRDLYVDRTIDDRYTVACYREAIAALPEGLVYPSVRTAVTDALNSGILRLEQRGIVFGAQTELPAPRDTLP